MGRIRPRITAAVAGGISVVIGAVIYLTAPAITFTGEYVPLPDLPISPSPTRFGSQQMVGITTTVVGLVMFALSTGCYLGQVRSRRSTSRLAEVAAIFGALMLVMGAALYLNSPLVSFGWFAYAPLSETAFIPTTIVSPQTVASVTAAVVGLIVFSFSTGWYFGHKRSRRA